MLNQSRLYDHNVNELAMPKISILKPNIRRHLSLQKESHNHNKLYRMLSTYTTNFIILDHN